MIVLVILPANCLSSSLSATDNASAAVPDVGSEIEVADGSLDYTYLELFDLYPYSVSFGAGHVRPWQFQKFGGEVVVAENFQVALSVGRGSFNSNRELTGEPVLIEQQSQSLLVSLRHFPSQSLPFFYSIIAGPNLLQGSIRPTSNSAATNTFSQRYSTNFTRSELVIGFNTGILWMFQNRFFLEFAVLQASRSLPLADQFDTPDKQVKSNVRDALDAAIVWSGMNLSIGYRF